MKHLPIYGFGIGGYRSFSGAPQIMGPFKKVNIFIGENNSGKSNILRFIRDVYQPVAARNGRVKPLSGSDVPQGGQTTNILPIMLPATDEHLKQIRPDLPSEECRMIRAIMGKTLPGPACVVDYSIVNNVLIHNVENALAALSQNDRALVSRAWSRVTSRGSGDIRQHWIPELMDWFYAASVRPAPVHYVPTLRQIPTKLAEFTGEYGGVTEGKTIADDLAALANPDHTRPSERKKFDAITNFMRGVLKRPELRVSVPHDKSTIIVEDYERYLPIEALGTGLHQLLILAIRAILVEDSVICIEEPELHLHPELQQQLMHFLFLETSNQYFVTTHSATIMDAVESDIYSVRLEGRFSKIDKPLTRSDRRSICHILGYRPSDLLQANSVIWVEGPTDRLYLLNWLKSIAPSLEEGWHFSIMFYGGKLANHLTVESEVSELIDLLPINRFPAIIMDSDKKKKGQHVNNTKKRLSEEFSKASGFAWITEGREIENYVPLEARERVLKDVTGEEFKLCDADSQYGHALAYMASGKEVLPDKIEFAKKACEAPLNLGVLDLKEQITALARFICGANRISFVQAK